MEIHEVVTAPRSPWQNAYAERLIGSIRRECLDHVIVWNARGLRRIFNGHVAYYPQSRTHLSLEKDAPIPRAIVARSDGRIVAIPQVGGLQHRSSARRRNTARVPSALVKVDLRTCWPWMMVLERVLSGPD